MSSKYKENKNGEFSHDYFNSSTKTVLGLKYGLYKSFQEVFNGKDNWISEKSGWISESIDDEYVNISVYSPLLGSS